MLERSADCRSFGPKGLIGVPASTRLGGIEDGRVSCARHAAGWPPALLWLASVLLCALSCSGGGQVGTVEEDVEDTVVVQRDTLVLVQDKPLPESVDELFGDFFYNFATDELFARSRVRFPLRSRANPDEEFITREQWVEQLPMQGRECVALIYEREGDLEVQQDTTLRQVQVWQIYLGEHREECYYFLKVDGRWLLRDYDVLDWSTTPLGGFLDYLAQMSADTLMYADYVRFPLQWVMVSDDGEETITEELWAEDWDELREEIPLPEGELLCIDYGQPALSENRKVVSMEGLSSGLFIKYKFDRVGGRWWLYEVEV